MRLWRSRLDPSHAVTKVTFDNRFRHIRLPETVANVTQTSFSSSFLASFQNSELHHRAHIHYLWRCSRDFSAQALPLFSVQHWKTGRSLGTRLHNLYWWWLLPYDIHMYWAIYTLGLLNLNTVAIWHTHVLGYLHTRSSESKCRHRAWMLHALRVFISQSNGLIEILNQTVDITLLKLVNDHWDNFLDLQVFTETSRQCTHMYLPNSGSSWTLSGHWFRTQACPPGSTTVADSTANLLPPSTVGHHW